MIIDSILDTDFYKLTIQQFILQQYPNAVVEYSFNNRDKSMIYNKKAFEVLKEEIKALSLCQLTKDEKNWLQTKSLFSNYYLNYLENYRFNLNQLDINLDESGQLNIKITGKWVDTVLWEVPLMAIISEVYFQECDQDWNDSTYQQIAVAKYKGEKLAYNECTFSDFGTRRRRSKLTQNIILTKISAAGHPFFNGTSNPYFAKKHDLNVIGTMAHEVICAISALESMNHPNRFAMDKWREVYGDKLSVFLPDTYGISSFFKDFNSIRARQWKGLRHDSGCPFEFTDKVLEHYKLLDIDPLKDEKFIVFSDSLNAEKAIKLNEYCRGKINCSFGIGTNFTNDYYKSKSNVPSKPMNMVIKLVKCNGVNVCKLSQNPEKAMGDKDAIRIMNHIHFGKTL